MTRLVQIGWFGTGLLFLLFPSNPASAQTEISARTATITVGGRLHAQLSSTTVDDAGPTNIFLRRARLYVGYYMAKGCNSRKAHTLAYKKAFKGKVCRSH